jgi:hypothetical protein
MERQEKLETTLGDLVVALTEEAAPFVRDEREAYQVVAFMLTHLLSKPSVLFTSERHIDEARNESKKHSGRRSRSYGT